jgi:hypothetical protein
MQIEWVVRIKFRDDASVAEYDCVADLRDIGFHLSDREDAYERSGADSTETARVFKEVQDAIRKRDLRARVTISKIETQVIMI